MLTVYYLVAIICGFYCYREFKFQMQEKMAGQLGQMGEAAMAENNAAAENNNRQNNF